MATPRRRFLRVADYALRADLSAEDVGIQARLLAWLNTRRARDLLEPAEAERATLGRADLHQVTGRSLLRPAVERLRTCWGPGGAEAPIRIDGGRDPITIELLEADPTASSRPGRCDPAAKSRRSGSGLAVIFWRNCAEFQGWGARSSGEDRPLRTPDSDTVHTDPKRTAAGRPRRRADPEPAMPELELDGATLDELVSHVQGVPERLSARDRQTFSRWLHTKYPPLWREREELEKACLRHYRRHPDRAMRVRSWLAACEGWAAVAWQRRSQRGLWPHPVGGAG